MSTIKRNDSTEIRNTALWASLSFVVPVLIMTAAMALSGITPFGNNTMINDANAAWFESFNGMYRSVVSGEGVFYRLNEGFGSSFYSEFASGLCSPFLFLSLFFGQRSLAAAYSFITIVRAGASGAAAWYFLEKCTSTGKSMSFALSCGYSLCGFSCFASYYPSVADGAVFLPLLAAGIYGFVQESRPVRLFVFGVLFFLTCSRLTLLGIILGFALYFAFYFRRDRKRQRVYKSAMFAATLICSAATNAVLVIPVWSGSVNYKNGVFSDIAPNDILSDLCFGGYGTTPAGGMGLCLAELMILGFFAFLCNTKILIGEKLSVASGAAFLIVCHAVKPLAKFTLGFGNSDGEAISAGFMLALLAVYCSARVIAEREGWKKWGVVCPVALYFLMAVISFALKSDDVFSVMAESGLAVFSCAVFVQLFVSSVAGFRLPAVTAAALALFGAVHCAGAVGGIHSGVTADNLSYIADSRIHSAEQLEKTYRSNNEEIPRFYRTRSTDGISESVDINSNYVEGLTEFAERLGIMRASEFGGADNFTEFTDILFGIAQTDYAFYTKEDTKNKACSPAYLIGNWDNAIPDGLNAFELQNYLAEQWFGATVFEPVEPTEHTTEFSSESSRYKWTFGNETTVVEKYEFELPEDVHLYMLVPDRDYSFAINSDSRSEWRKGCSGGIFSLSREAGKLTVFLSADVADGSPEPVFMTYGGGLDSAVIAKCADYISYRGSTVRFMFDISRSQIAITSVPYEEGWNITVNGKSVKPVNLCGGLIGLHLEKGANSVVMTYTPPYFRTSLWISCILFAVGLYLTLKVEHEAARRRKVRMAFRAVELNISRMTVNQLKDHSDGENSNTQEEPIEEKKTEQPSENDHDQHESEESEK
ncbi:MAG: YfhO family protein [Clostridia bacterium]|nr:YfhO family protein [Clostridia bacterium]